MSQDMHELITDVDYQAKYDMDKRIDLFNKYKVDMSAKFFVPIWALMQYIRTLYDFGYDKW